MAEKQRRQVWVLDTETKGTGAEMMPLEKAQRQKRSGPPRERVSVIRRDRDRGVRDSAPVGAPADPPEGPRRFKLVDVSSREPLAEDVEAREAVKLLEDVGRIGDVHVYVRVAPGERWRPLTLAEKKALWRFRSGDSALVWNRDRDRSRRAAEHAGDGADESERIAARHGASIAAAAHRGGSRARLGRAPRSRPGGNR